MKKYASYQKAVAFLMGLSNLPQKNYMRDQSDPSVYLKRMEYFLELLGHPEQGFKFIHITGTAGKGTVTTMLHNVLFANRQKVGSFMSPTITTLIEAIRVNEQFISPNIFAELLEQIKPFIDQAHQESPYGLPSTFEIQLAMAFLYFKRMQCEWVVLEVGMGGRYDATNVIKDPKVTVITNIDYDHTNLLGKTLEEIVQIKSGIIKTGSAFFTSERRRSLLTYLKTTCEHIGAHFHTIQESKIGLDRNQQLVTTIAEYLKIDRNAIQTGIQHTRLPCRFERMEVEPSVILDGAHNAIKMRYMVKNLLACKYKKLILILGTSADKDQRAILREIAPPADYLFFTRFQSTERACADPKTLHAIAKPYVKKSAKTALFLDPQQALLAARHIAHPEDLILVTGSFFLAGELRQNWISEELILKQRSAFPKK